MLWNEWHWKRHQLLADTTAYHGFIQEPQTCMTNHRPFRTKKGLCIWLTHHEAFQNLNTNLAFIRLAPQRKNQQEQSWTTNASHGCIQASNRETGLTKPKAKRRNLLHQLSIAPWQRLDIQDTKIVSGNSFFCRSGGGKKLGDHLIMSISQNEKKGGKLWWIALGLGILGILRKLLQEIFLFQPHEIVAPRDGGMPIHSNMPCQCFPTSSWPQTHQGGKLVCPTTLGTFWKK